MSSCPTIGSTTTCSDLTSSLPTTNSTRESATAKADGHLDTTATLDVRRVRHEVHGEPLMIAAVVVASRKTNQYRCRVCFTFAEPGRVLTCLTPPFSLCACYIHR